jgi:hypothetical protein
MGDRKNAAGNDEVRPSAFNGLLGGGRHHAQGVRSPGSGSGMSPAQPALWVAKAEAGKSGPAHGIGCIIAIGIIASHQPNVLGALRSIRGSVKLGDHSDALRCDQTNLARPANRAVNYCGALQDTARAGFVDSTSHEATARLSASRRVGEGPSRDGNLYDRNCRPVGLAGFRGNEDEHSAGLGQLGSFVAVTIRKRKAKLLGFDDLGGALRGHGFS